MDSSNLLLMWNYAYIKIIDVRHIQLNAGERLSSYKLPAHAFLVVAAGEALVSFHHYHHRLSSFHLLHGGKGLSITIEAINRFEYFIILYKASLPLTFRPGIMQLWQQQNPFYDHYTIRPSSPLPLYRLAEEMYNYWQMPSSYNRLQVKSGMYRFIVELMQQLDEKQWNAVKPDLISFLRKYIHDHFKEPVTLEILAAETGYSVGYISKQFKEHMQMSPIHYLGKVRIEHASKLLIETNATLQQIAELVGYPDGFALSRSFKRYKGESPALFKRKKHNYQLDEELLYDSAKYAILPKSSKRYSVLECDNHYHLKGDVSKTMYKSFKLTAATIMLCITLLISACSGTTNSANQPSPETTVSQQPSSASGSQAESNQEQAVQKETRTISTPKGDVEVPLNPERVASDQYMGHLIKLGIIPVGVREGMLDEAWMEKAGITEEILSKIENLGAFPMNPEKLAMLEPDLIIGSIEANIEQYEEIGTTVFVPYWEELSTSGPIEKFRKISAIFGKEQEADQWIKSYEQDVEKAREQIAGIVGEGETVSVVQLSSKAIYVLAAEGGNYGSATIYQMLKLPPTEQALNMKDGFANVSFEALPQYLGDHVFVYINSKEDADEVLNSPIWKNADAVKKGNVYMYGEFGDEFVMEDPFSLELQLQKITSVMLEKK